MTAPLPDRSPPYNLDAEHGVIGAVLLDNSRFPEVRPILTAADFWLDDHQTVWRAIVKRLDLGQPVDGVILADDLRRGGQFDRVGGDDLISRCLLSIPHATNARFHAGIVHEKAIVRRVIESCGAILSNAYSQSMTADDLVRQMESAALRLTDHEGQDEGRELGVVVDDVMVRVGERCSGVKTGISTGLHALDSMTDGLQPKQLVILAARTSMGKTAMMLNICEHVALEESKHVAVVSLEMDEVELAERSLVSLSRIDNQKIKRGVGLDDYHYEAMTRAVNRLKRAGPRFVIYQPTGLTFPGLASMARRAALKRGLDLLVVDYLQLIRGENKPSRQEQVAAITRDLKDLARELNIPIIVLSQMNRENEKRKDKRPLMSDLRDSGAVEQDADVVLFIHRPEYYDPSDKPGMAELKIAKNRNGKTGTVDLMFHKPLMRFEDHHEYIPPAQGSLY